MGKVLVHFCLSKANHCTKIVIFKTFEFLEKTSGLQITQKSADRWYIGNF